MELPTLNARFFRTATGVEPVRDWLKSLPSLERKAIGDEIRAIQFSWPIVRKMESGLWEVRVRLASRIARVLFTVIKGEMVLLHGFIKQSEKTAQSDLELARRRRSLLNDF